jgi:hydroxymethylglutaryl-CoA reductase
VYFLGGGTKISAQQACSKMFGIDSYLSDISDENSCQLTHLICFTVLTSELSLLSA